MTCRSFTPLLGHVMPSVRPTFMRWGGSCVACPNNVMCAVGEWYECSGTFSGCSPCPVLEADLFEEYVAPGCLTNCIADYALNADGICIPSASCPQIEHAIYPFAGSCEFECLDGYFRTGLSCSACTAECALGYYELHACGGEFDLLCVPCPPRAPTTVFLEDTEDPCDFGCAVGAVLSSDETLCVDCHVCNEGLTSFLLGACNDSGRCVTCPATVGVNTHYTDDSCIESCPDGFDGLASGGVLTCTHSGPGWNSTSANVLGNEVIVAFEFDTTATVVVSAADGGDDLIVSVSGRTVTVEVVNTDAALAVALSVTVAYSSVFNVETEIINIVYTPSPSLSGPVTPPTAALGEEIWISGTYLASVTSLRVGISLGSADTVAVHSNSGTALSFLLPALPVNTVYYVWLVYSQGELAVSGSISRDPSIVSFTPASNAQPFTVPSGVTAISVRAWGAAGGGGVSIGGHSTGVISVVGGDELCIVTGGVGHSYSGAGSGGSGGGQAGGGLSGIFAGANGCMDRESSIIIAGGGAGVGGNTNTNPGNGGGTNGCSSYTGDL